MHEPVKTSLENYLAGSDSLPREFATHLSSCVECRQEVSELEAQAILVRSLRCPGAEFEPAVGFYARVIERIDTQRQSSFWTIFLEPAFGRRLAVASAVFAVLMGLYLVGSEPDGTSLMANRPAVVMLPGEDEPGPVLGADQDQDRGAILVNLASFQQEQ